MPRKKKEIEVIDLGGAKTVKKKQSVITWTKRIFAIITRRCLCCIYKQPTLTKQIISLCEGLRVVEGLDFRVRRLTES